MRDTVLGIIAERTGQTPEQVFEDSLRDHMFSAEEARDYGFVDHLVTDLGQVRPHRRRTTGLHPSGTGPGGAGTAGGQA